VRNYNAIEQSNKKLLVPQNYDANIKLFFPQENFREKSYSKRNPLHAFDVNNYLNDSAAKESLLLSPKDSSLKQTGPEYTLISA